MKAIFAALVLTASVSAHAFGLESFYGKPVQKGHVWSCAYTNKTQASQDMKYVVFSFERLSGGENSDFEVQTRIDQVVRTGETLAATTEDAMAFKANFCKYLAR